MRRKLFSRVYLAVILLVVFVWSPWLTQTFAKSRAVNSFNRSWSSVIDGCGTTCRGCGAIKAQRVLLGMEVTLEYGCGLMPEDTSKYHEQATGFVSTFGTVHGFPRP